MTTSTSVSIRPKRRSRRSRRRRRESGSGGSDGGFGRDPPGGRDSIRAMMLIRTYRVRGHLAAKLDPLGLHRQELPADLTPEYHGFGRHRSRPPDLDRRDLGFRTSDGPRNRCSAAGQLLRHGRRRIYAHQRLDERRFIQERIEGKDAEIQFTPEGKPRSSPRSSRRSSGRSSSRANMSARKDLGSTAAKARSRHSKR